MLVGALDAANEALDDTEVMVWAMARAGPEERTAARVGIASNGSMRGIGRHPARRKIELMGESVRVGSMGPLNEVAEALDPVLLESKIVPLREMAQAVEAARQPRRVKYEASRRSRSGSSGRATWPASTAMPSRRRSPRAG